MQVKVSSVACIFVLFNPEKRLIDTVNRLDSCGYKIIVVVNAAKYSLINSLSQLVNVSILENQGNVGLAKALNIGIIHAFNKLNCEFVALFDQDSSPTDHLPVGLAQELMNVNMAEAACCGPMLIDEKKPWASYPKTISCFSKTCPGSIPTSGTVISKISWVSVGPMLDQLFIDGIDHEWCFRACNKGLKVYRSSQHTMKHNMGDVGVSIFGVYKPIHRSPFRHYFIIRNSIFLSTLSYIPLRWRLVELLKTVRRIFVYTFVSTNRIQSTKMMVKALSDGIRGKLGPLNVSLS